MANIFLDDEKSLVALKNSTALVKEYQHTDPAKAVSALMDALTSEYLVELLVSPPEKVGQLQAAIRQVMAIKSVLAGGEHASARISIS